MARWRLTANHYLHVDGTEWEYSEMNRSSGRPIRKKFKVPMFLDVQDPSMWTETNVGPDGKPYEGWITVSDGHNAQPRDIVFEGPPTPDMDPVDDEARAISDLHRQEWRFPAEAEPGSFAQGLVDTMQAQLSALQASQATPPVAGMEELLGAMKGMMEQNQLILQALLINQTKTAEAERRA